MKDKLKPCPFCGGKAHIEIIDHDSHGKKSYKVIIYCGTWNCDVKREFYWFNTEKQVIQCSIDLWNNRVDEPKLPEDSVVYKDGKIYYNGEHIGYIDFSFYEDIKALGFGNFEIIDKRKGYGTLVIRDIIHKYKDKYNLIYCFVDKENIGAIEFYKKVGKVRIDIVNEKGQYQVILYGKENSAVLSREEYERLKRVESEKDRLYEIKLDLENQLIEKGWTDYEGADEIEKRVSKETAEKYHNLLKEKIENSFIAKFQETWLVFNEFNDELAKQFGVDLGE